ncbi:MAG: ABC transporter permease [Chloroflexi bacterium]|nr:ABC transporter permease [Chloroflexota bacterium]
MHGLRVALFLAYKSILKGNRWALALTVLVMALSFVNLIFTSSILSGVTTTLDRQLIDTSLANIVLSPPENRYYLDNAADIERQVRQFPEVAGVSAHLNAEGFFEYRWQEKRQPADKGRSGRWDVVGINPEDESRVTTIHGQMIEGSYLARNDRDQIVLGVEIAGGEQAQSSPFLTLGGVKAGEKVRLTYPNGVRREYTVKGIFRAREMIRTDHLAFVSRAEMVSVMGRSVYADRATQVLVRVNPGADEDALVERLRRLDLGAQVRGWQEYGGALRSMVSTFSIIAGLIGGVGLTVAAIVMFIVIYINLVSKRRQIGILRAIGVKQDIIIGSYLTQAVLFALAGTGIGWAIIHFGLDPYFRQNPMELPIGLVSLTIKASTIQSSIFGLVGAAVLAGFIPAWAVMKQSIIKAIWGN